jgi:hypothetical protein
MKQKQTKKRWTAAEVERLKRYTSEGRYTFAQIAELMGRTIQSVSLKSRRLGIKKKGISLSDEKIKWLKRNYGYMRNVIITTYLGIGLSGLRRTAKQLGLHKSKEFKQDAAVPAYTATRERAARLRRLRQDQSQA